MIYCKKSKIIFISDGNSLYEKKSIADELKVFFAKSEYDLIISQSLKDGVCRLEAEKFSALLLDLGVNDVQSIKTIKQLIQSTQDLPIIFFVDSLEQSQNLNNIFIGVNEFIPKRHLKYNSFLDQIRFMEETFNRAKANSILFKYNFWL